MSENLLKQIASINMRNFLIVIIALIWGFAQIKSITTNTDFTAQAQTTVTGLQNIMLMVLGFYLKSKLDSKSEKEEE